jgi:hypothetical protein
MRKEELNEQQLKTRAEIIRVLNNAGWQEAANNQLFDRGYWLEFEVRMEYQNPTMNVAVEYQAERQMIFLSISNRLGRSLRIMIDFADQLYQLLDIVVGFQNAITAENYKEYIKKLLAAFPSIYMDLGDEVVKLVDKSDLQL